MVKLKAQGFSNRDIAQILFEKHSVSVSHVTVYRELKRFAGQTTGGIARK
jgi:transposase